MSATRQPKPDETPQPAPKQADDQPETPVSTTIDGGRYLNADGVLVNSEGQPITKDGKVKKADE
jgi:hypothetical protein